MKSFLVVPFRPAAYPPEVPLLTCPKPSRSPASCGNVFFPECPFSELKLACHRCLSISTDTGLKAEELAGSHRREVHGK